MLGSLSLSSLWVVLLSFVSKTARGITCDAARLKTTGDVVVFRLIDGGGDILVGWVPASKATMLFPPTPVSEADIGGVVDRLMSAATETETIKRGLPLFIDAVEGSMLDLLMGGPGPK